MLDSNYKVTFNFIFCNCFNVVKKLKFGQICAVLLSTAIHLRNELEFWNGHGIMNTSQLLCKRPEVVMIP